jgi:hypothetical protein
MGNLTFDANQVEPTSFEPVPVGKYVAAITETEIKQTKAGNGKYIAFTLEILEGDYKGRKVWGNLNIQNPSAKAQQIGLGQLSAICRACGKLNLSDTSELHGVPFIAKIGQEPDMNGNPRNTFKEALWKETTKPDLSAFATGTGQARVDLSDDQVPF